MQDPHPTPAEIREDLAAVAATLRACATILAAALAALDASSPAPPKAPPTGKRHHKPAKTR